jgi:hypothetical protein
MIQAQQTRHHSKFKHKHKLQINLKKEISYCVVVNGATSLHLRHHESKIHSTLQSRKFQNMLHHENKIKKKNDFKKETLVGNKCC